MVRLAKSLPKKPQVQVVELPKEDSDELKALKSIQEALASLPKPQPPKEVQFPQVQKVEVVNQVETKEVELPDPIEEVRVSNLSDIKIPEPPFIQKVEVVNNDGKKGEATETKQVEAIEQLKRIGELLAKLQFNKKGELKTDAAGGGGGGTGGNFLGGILSALEDVSTATNQTAANALLTSILSALGGTLTVSPTPPSGCGSGQKNVAAAGTAEALGASTTITSVTVKAKRSNTGNIYVGTAGVISSTGHILERGSSVSINIDDLAKVFIDADSNGEGVSFFYVTP